jgi:hypothetical protein
MKAIHRLPGSGGRFRLPGNRERRANIAGFLKVADAMLDQGLV